MAATRPGVRKDRLSRDVIIVIIVHPFASRDLVFATNQGAFVKPLFWLGASVSKWRKSSLTSPDYSRAGRRAWWCRARGSQRRSRRGGPPGAIHRSPDAQRLHEMLHVELVSTAGALAFLFGELDFFFGDVGERATGDNAPGESITICKSLPLSNLPVAVLLQPPSRVIHYVINGIITRQPWRC